LIRQNGGTPAFKGYHGFPGTLCTNINEVVVHGIPSKNDILKEGDLITIDCGVFFKGLCTDSARTVAIGKISAEKQLLLKTAQRTLSEGIDAAVANKGLNNIGETVQKTIETAGFHVIYDLTGHGVGRKLHEAPTINNYAQNTPGPLLKPGMTLAIEPIFSVGTSQIKTLPDNWTIVTTDGSCAIQEEHTILITENGPEILTQLK
jgi:methionyl aminopeptidase